MPEDVVELDDQSPPSPPHHSPPMQFPNLNVSTEEPTQIQPPPHKNVRLEILRARLGKLAHNPRTTDPEGQLPYDFSNFSPSKEEIECYGLPTAVVRLLNRHFHKPTLVTYPGDIIFGVLSPSLVTVVDILDRYLCLCPNNPLLLEYIEQLIASCKGEERDGPNPKCLEERPLKGPEPPIELPDSDSEDLYVPKRQKKAAKQELAAGSGKNLEATASTSQPQRPKPKPRTKTTKEASNVSETIEEEDKRFLLSKKSFSASGGKKKSTLARGVGKQVTSLARRSTRSDIQSTFGLSANLNGMISEERQIAESRFIFPLINISSHYDCSGPEAEKEKDPWAI